VAQTKRWNAAPGYVYPGRDLLAIDAPDYLNCAFYAPGRAYAPEPFKSQWTKIAKYCYKAYHGADDGYDRWLRWPRPTESAGWIPGVSEAAPTPQRSSRA